MYNVNMFYVEVFYLKTIEQVFHFVDFNVLLAFIWNTNTGCIVRGQMIKYIFINKKTMYEAHKIIYTYKFNFHFTIYVLLVIKRFHLEVEQNKIIMNFAPLFKSLNQKH